MNKKELLSRLNKEQRNQLIDLVNAETDPKLNGGHYLSPLEWKREVNNALSKVLGEITNVSANTLNSIMDVIDPS